MTLARRQVDQTVLFGHFCKYLLNVLAPLGGPWSARGYTFGAFRNRFGAPVGPDSSLVGCFATVVDIF